MSRYRPTMGVYTLPDGVYGPPCKRSGGRPKGSPKTGGRLPAQAVVDAIAAGNSIYYNNVPCKNGHNDGRYVKNRNCVTCANKITREHKRKNPRQQKDNWLKLNYNISLDIYEEMLSNQNSKCLICCDAFVAPPHVDHCHSTGKVRGLLCKQCNNGLGFFKDNTAVMLRAIQYLERNK